MEPVEPGLLLVEVCDENGAVARNAHAADGAGGICAGSNRRAMERHAAKIGTPLGLWIKTGQLAAIVVSRVIYTAVLPFLHGNAERLADTWDRLIAKCHSKRP